MKGKYKCDDKLKIYYPVNYKENLNQAQKLYVPGLTNKHNDNDNRRQPLYCNTVPNVNMKSVLKNYMNDYKRMMAIKKRFIAKAEYAIDPNDFAFTKGRLQSVQLAYDYDFVDDRLDLALNRELELEDCDYKDEVTIKKEKIEEDYKRRLGINTESNKVKEKDKDSLTEEKVNQSKLSKASSKKSNKTDNVKPKTPEELNKELNESKSKSKSKSKKSISAKSSLSKKSNKSHSKSSIKNNDIPSDHDIDSNHNHSNVNLTEELLPVPVIKDNDLFETDQNLRMFTDIENRVLTSTKTDIMNSNQLQLDSNPQHDISIRQIQLSYRRHLENKKRTNLKFIYSNWDNSNENLIMIYYDKIADEGDQVLSLFVQIHSTNKMETYEEIISASELIRIGVFTEGKISKGDIREQKVLIAKVLFEEYHKKAESELEKKRNEYAMVFDENKDNKASYKSISKANESKGTSHKLMKQMSDSLKESNSGFNIEYNDEL